MTRREAQYLPSCSLSGTSGLLVLEAMGFRESVLTTLVCFSFLQYASLRCLLPNLYIFVYFNLVSRFHLVFTLMSYYLSASF